MSCAPMHVPLLDLRPQFAAIQSEIHDAIDAVLASQRFVLGSQVSALETEVARFCRAPHAVGVASGSDALLLALMDIGLGNGDEVITTPYTFFATAAAVVRLGGIPVFVDIDPTTYNLAVEQVKARITPRTKAIIPVHLYGQCADMAPLLTLARECGLSVIEDAAQVLGAQYLLPQSAASGGETGGRWHRAGAMGELGCLSFYPSKVLGAYGDAGMVLARGAALAGRVRTLCTHGEVGKYHHELIGVNSRLDEPQAAVLRVKLRYLDDWIAARQARAARYDQLFRETGLASTSEAWNDGSPLMLPVIAPPCTHIFYVSAVRVRHRDRLRAYLSDHGVGTDVYYPLPLHLQPCFAPLGFRQGDFPAAERAAEASLALPMYPELSEAQQVYVVEQIARFYTRLKGFAIPPQLRYSQVTYTKLFSGLASLIIMTITSAPGKESKSGDGSAHLWTRLVTSEVCCAGAHAFRASGRPRRTSGTVSSGDADDWRLVDFPHLERS